MNPVRLLFGFQGRIGRLGFWVATATQAAVIVAVVLLGAWAARSDDGLVLVAAALVGAPLFLAACYSALAVAVKRLHDRDKSGWWVLLFYAVPDALYAGGAVTGGASVAAGLAGAAITIWAFVELGFLAGTEGPNAYGPDPHAWVAGELAY
jgi:uncharacterized membrane protein YhaH (DUF805 family)